MTPSNSPHQSAHSSLDDPRAEQPVLTAGPPPDNAEAAIILIHGRSASADGMLKLYRILDAERFAAIAPQAAESTWYPNSFLAPIESNQPWLDSALRCIETLASGLIDCGIEARRLALLGFSQGACLVSEFAARHPRPYGAVMALTGGLIGPPGTPREYTGSLAGARIFLGTGDPDPHVPFERVRETEQVLSRMGAQVELRRYPGMTHTIGDDELEVCRAMLKQIE